VADLPSGSGGAASGEAPQRGSADEAAGASAGGRALGLREALLVGELVVVVVLLAGVVTYLLPGDARDVVLRTPLLIVVLIGGTAGVLWRISRPAGPDR
jgi:hypothetical protein